MLFLFAPPDDTPTQGQFTILWLQGNLDLLYSTGQNEESLGLTCRLRVVLGLVDLILKLWNTSSPPGGVYWEILWAASHLEN